jgi:hypothetical protein
MQTIKLNEEQLYQLIKESVEETMLDEGLWDNIKAGFRGMKQGYQAQQSIDADNNNRKHHWDREDMNANFNPLSKNPENTASMEANKLYDQFKEYRSIANKLLAKRNQLIKQYGLVVDPQTKMCTDPTPNNHYTGTKIPGSMRTSALDLQRRYHTRPVGM